MFFKSLLLVATFFFSLQAQAAETETVKPAAVPPVEGKPVNEQALPGQSVPGDAQPLPEGAVSPSSSSSSSEQKPLEKTFAPPAERDKLKGELEKLDQMRSKLIGNRALVDERIAPLAEQQKQIVSLENLLGRSNPNVVVFYHLLAKRYQQQAYLNGRFADSERMYKWLTDTETAAQKGIDELLMGAAYLALADCYRHTGRYDLALSTYQRSIPIFLRGKKAATEIVADYKKIGESAIDKDIKRRSDAAAKAVMAANKNYIMAMDKSLGKERYDAPPVADAYFGMAVCYFKKNERSKAEEYLARAKKSGLRIIDNTKVVAAPGRARAKTAGKARPR